MRILIVEDNNNKLGQITTFLKNTFSELSIHDAVSYTGALRRIYAEEWDLIILDMTLPIYDTEVQTGPVDLKSRAGEEIMRRMINRERIIPVIIITQFETFGNDEVTLETLNKLFEEECQKVWIGTIKYVDSLNNWKDELEALVRRVMG